MKLFCPPPGDACSGALERVGAGYRTGRRWTSSAPGTGRSRGGAGCTRGPASAGAGRQGSAAGPTPSATAPARRRTVKRWQDAPCDRADGSGRSIMSRRGTDWAEIGEAEGRRNSCRERSSGPAEMRREVRLYSKWNIHSRNSRFDEGRSPIPRPEPSHRAGPHPPLPAPMGGRQPGEGPACGLCRRHAGMPRRSAVG